MRAVRRHPGVLERTPRGVRKHWRADARHSERDLRKAVCSPSLVALAAPVLFLDHSSCATMQRRTRHVVKQCSARDAALPQDHPASRQPSIAHLRLGQPKRPPVLVCSDASESPGSRPRSRDSRCRGPRARTFLRGRRVPALACAHISATRRQLHLSAQAPGCSVRAAYCQ